MSNAGLERRVRRVPSTRQKWLLVLVALGASLLAAEATLQLASLIVRQTVSRACDRVGDPGADAVTILCVGDSHTYGLPLPVRRTLMNLKLFRLASLAWFNATGHQSERVGRGGWYEGELPPSGRLPKGADMPDPAPGLAFDLARIASLTASFDLPVLFVTYPLKASEPINRIIEATAGRLGVGVIDSRPELIRARADGHTDAELIDTRSGPHPSALLYAYLVESMLPVVTSTLEAWHGLGPAEPADRLTTSP